MAERRILRHHRTIVPESAFVTYSLGVSLTRTAYSSCSGTRARDMRKGSDRDQLEETTPDEVLRQRAIKCLQQRRDRRTSFGLLLGQHVHRVRSGSCRARTGSSGRCSQFVGWGMASWTNAWDVYRNDEFDESQTLAVQMDFAAADRRRGAT